MFALMFVSDKTLFSHQTFHFESVVKCARSNVILFLQKKKKCSRHVFPMSLYVAVYTIICMVKKKIFVKTLSILLMRIISLDII